MILFSLPFQDLIYTVAENSENSAVSFIDFNGQNQVNFYGQIKNTESKLDVFNNFSVKDLPEFKNEDSIINESEYLAKVTDVIDFIHENELKKLVFSRRKLINFKEIKLVESFKNLRQNFPNALSYLFIKDETCWIGAFSEILGKYNKKTGIFETMSVAGTLPLSETWTNKEIEEQKTVTNYISDILKKYSENVHQSETKDHISGNIKHLKTEFSLKIKPENIENIIAELHPTPAVCGIPKEICKTAIQNFENSNRELYAGYIKIETDEFLYYFVNLRCAKIYKESAILFVGGGITKDSNPQKEWRETELKAEAIAKNLVLL
ncbi:chorismate-binding protein [Frigoriflavimonas asaccharolytica]|uniref:Isochorismate synthase n=1 Tax=Frigoriflavimonas asaccharolytica TaxID=2735899 RepID=A0A8J8K8R4_9FLAO|nr:chorismate-binding protein [Frigoriflavimonas asaccharolytica]NRS92866.1 isochorismate synthase [Frigoriflavimonas asaccharolytica]